jgi:hypothetical protein
MALLDLLSSGFLTSKGVTSTNATGSMSNATQAGASFLTTKGVSANTAMTGSGVGVSQAGTSFYTSKGINSSGGPATYIKTLFNGGVSAKGPSGHYNFVPPSAPPMPFVAADITTEVDESITTQIGFILESQDKI